MSPFRVPAPSHAVIMDYNEACFMHLTPGVVQNQLSKGHVFGILIELELGQSLKFWSQSTQ